MPNRLAQGLGQESIVMMNMKMLTLIKELSHFKEHQTGRGTASTQVSSFGRM